MTQLFGAEDLEKLWKELEYKGCHAKVTFYDETGEKHRFHILSKGEYTPEKNVLQLRGVSVLSQKEKTLVVRFRGFQFQEYNTVALEVEFFQTERTMKYFGGDLEKLREALGRGEKAWVSFVERNQERYEFGMWGEGEWKGPILTFKGVRMGVSGHMIALEISPFGHEKGSFGVFLTDFLEVEYR